MDLGLRDRVAIVTGASKGIGRQVAADLGAEGCHVVLCGRDEAALRETAADIERGGARAIVVTADMELRETARPIAQRAADEFGRVDILVNNAGGNHPRRLLNLSDDDWQQGFEQNFFSAVRLALACVPIMQQRRWGRIVNIASTFAREPDPLFGPYSAAKAALVNFSRNLSMAFAADGVLTNCVLPGITITEGVEANAAVASERLGISPDEVMARMIEKDPIDIGRFAEPSEVSGAILFLASEQAGWITGSTVTVDGGTIRVAP
jgi:NAD(P)-dependent dehydrogenase (short-subunit alcohol dehydrogenase family)